MASWEPGRSVSVLGPFGNGFEIPADLQTAALVAGGIGIAPLLFLSKSLSSEFQHIKIIFFFGSRNHADSALLTSASDHMQAHGCIHVTEDGSTEHAGLVTDAFESSVTKGELGAGRTCIYSCGPMPMLKRVARIAAAYGIPCQVSLEAHMACGVGACLGCVVEAKSGFKRVCADGPVFDSRVLGWNYD
jgi:dihydroorotate dehydrogenase electron transfer subunit